MYLYSFLNLFEYCKLCKSPLKSGGFYIWIAVILSNLQLIPENE